MASAELSVNGQEVTLDCRVQSDTSQKESRFDSDPPAPLLASLLTASQTPATLATFETRIERE